MKKERKIMNKKDGKKRPKEPKGPAPKALNPLGEKALSDRVFIIEEIETSKVTFDTLSEDHKYDGEVVNILAGPLDQSCLRYLSEVWQEKYGGL